MKTITLTLFAVALGFGQSQSSAPSAASAAPKDTPKTAATTAQKKPASQQPAKAQQSTTQPAKAQPAATQSIPAGAKLVEPGLYRYTDSNGKTWNYRQTPFGISKWEETSTPAAQPEPAAKNPVAVTDLGDSYRFEKKTPFGQSSWTRKKSELTDEEKAYTEQTSVSNKVAEKQ
jgi:hypothetical protein